MLKDILAEFISTEFKMSERFTNAMMANIERCKVGEKIPTLDGSIEISNRENHNSLEVRDGNKYVVIELEKYYRTYDEVSGKWLHNSALNNHKVLRSYGCMSRNGQNIFLKHKELNFS